MSPASQPRFLFAVKDWHAKSAENLADSTRHTFYLTLSGRSRLTETWVEGGARYAGREQAGTVTYIPRRAGASRPMPMSRAAF